MLHHQPLHSYLESKQTAPLEPVWLVLKAYKKNAKRRSLIFNKQRYSTGNVISELLRLSW